MYLIAHRGCADESPENTVRAIERSAARLPVVELDVRRCGSGELVAFHDETLDRLTEGAGRVSETPLRRLRTLDVLDSGEPIPLLSEALGAVPPGVRAQVELKEAGIADDVAARIDAAGVDAHVTSFLPGALDEVRRSAPATSTGYLFEPDAGVAAGLDVARELGCRALHPRADVCLETDAVERAHRAGMDAIAWDVRGRETVDRLRRRGVDGATVDSWSVAETRSVDGPENRRAASATPRPRER